MRSISVLSLVGLSVLLGSNAVAGPNHGVLCNPNPENVSVVGYNQFGAHNSSTTALATVSCGGGKGVTASNVLSATVYDRHNVDNVVCTFRVTNAAGDIIGSVTKSTAGFASEEMLLSANVTSLAGFVDVQCSIPRRHLTNGFSHVTTYSIP